jgi:hypothetical protein
VSPTLERLPEHLMTRGSDPTLLQGELIELIKRRIDNHPRSQQKTIGPSEIGTPCDRRLAHRLNETPPVNTGDDKWRPTVGTAVHDWLERALRDDDPSGNRWAPETKVTVGTIGNATITGKSDLYDRISATVVDWKIVGPTTLRDVKANGPKPGYRFQGHIYGLGFTNADLPVDVIMIAYLPSNGPLRDAHFWHEPYQPEIAHYALARANQTAALVYAFKANAAAVAGTADDYCTGCPWYMPAATDLTEACPGHPATGTATLTVAPTTTAA